MKFTISLQALGSLFLRKISYISCEIPAMCEVHSFFNSFIRRKKSDCSQNKVKTRFTLFKTFYKLNIEITLTNNICKFPSKFVTKKMSLILWEISVLHEVNSFFNSFIKRKQPDCSINKVKTRFTLFKTF